MKQILGDNQFFGINHYDLNKGNDKKKLFISNDSIIEFINESLNIGMDGFMMNSNSRGYEIVDFMKIDVSKEVHFSIPYPHKFASLVNENGLLFLLKYLISKSSTKSVLYYFPKFIFKKDVKYLLHLIVDLEIPQNLPSGSYIYLQNIVTDLLIGLKRYDLIYEFCETIIGKGFKPGIITLNPLSIDKILSDYSSNILQDLVVCFNINKTGFNVFPNLNDVHQYTLTKTAYKKMGMSILSSGSVLNVDDSLDYIKELQLDYVVYGTSSINNLIYNFNYLKK